jgi:hypothetical protein
MPTLLDEHRVGAAQRDAARGQQQPGARPLGGLDQLAAAEMISPQRARVAHEQPRLLVDLPAERRPLVDEPDLEAEPGGLVDGGEPGGPAADDEQVVALFPVCTQQDGIGGSFAPSVAL